MTVAFPPGGGSDLLGCVMAKGMQDTLGQPVIVENVAGVRGSLGGLKAANAAPDGYATMAGFYKKEAVTGAAMAKSINLLTQ